MQILLSDSLNKTISNEIYNLIIAIGNTTSKEDKEKVAANYIMSDTLYNVLNSNQLDQLTFVFYHGFSRTRKNYINQNLKNIGIGILSMGLVVPYSIKAKTNIIAIVFDKDSRSLVYLKRKDSETDPIEDQNMSNQVCDIFKGFYTKGSINGVCYMQ
jgi:hypothetical protein